MDENKYLLDSIGKNLEMWKQNLYTPGEKRMWVSSVTLIVANIYFWFFVGPNWTTQYLCSVAGIAVMPLLCHWFLYKQPKTWSEVLGRQLANYKPLNMRAWRLLQERIAWQGKLTLDSVEHWYRNERQHHQ